MSWTSLKNGIATVIKTNGNQEITGNALQGVLNSIVNALGAHATFAGIAIPSTSPGTPDGPVFYFALQAGSYSNFGATPFVVSEGEFGIFVWDGTTWSTLKYTPGVDLSEIVSELNTLGPKVEQLEDKVGGTTRVVSETSMSYTRHDGGNVKNTGAVTGSSSSHCRKYDVSGLQYVYLTTSAGNDRTSYSHYSIFAENTDVTVASNSLAHLAWASDDEAYNDFVEIPAGAKWLFTIDVSGISVKSVTVVNTNKIQDLQDDLEAVEESLTQMEEQLGNVPTFNTTTVASGSKELTGEESTTQVIFNKTCDLKAGDRINIVTSGIGSGLAATTYRLYFNDETFGDYTTDKTITLDTDVSKVKISIIANYIKNAGTVSFDVQLVSRLGKMSDDIDSVKTQLSQIQPIIDSVESINEELSISNGGAITWNTKGYCLSFSGKLSSNANYVHSKPIEVHRNDTLIFTSSLATSSIVPLAWVLVEDTAYVPIITASNTDNVLTEYRWKCPMDGYVAICTYQNKKGTLKILSGSDKYVDENAANILGLASLESEKKYRYGNLIGQWSNKIRLSEHQTNIVSTSVSSSYFSTGWIDVSGIKFLVLGGATPNKMFAFDSSLAAISVIGDTRNPIKLPAGTAYIKATYAIEDCAWDNRDILGIYPLATGFVSEDGYVTKNNIKDFAATKVYGTYSNATTFLGGDGTSVALDEAEIYIDITTGMQYRWNGTSLYELGYDDGKSLAFTSGFSLSVRRNEKSEENMIVTASAKFVRGAGVTGVPTICLSAKGGGTLQNYNTINYTIGRENQFSKKEWRAYPLSPSQTHTSIIVTIPAGVTLFVDSFGNYYSDKKGHTGTHPMLHCRDTNTPDCSLAHIEQAAKLGYEYIIVIPKRTFDGEWVILHDDANITATVRHEDGSALTDADLPVAATEAGITSIDNCPLSYFTYTELMAFDIGMSDDDYYQRNVGWRGQKIPRLEDFFEVCAKTGIHPVFSVHPNFTAEQWAEVKVLADKWKVTSRLNLKTGYISLFATTAYTAFGDKIESYYTDVNTDRDGVNEVLSFVSNTGCDTTKVRVGVEYFSEYITDARVANAIANGLAVGKVGGSSSEEYLSWVRKGVSSFTDMHNPSVGLNW